MSFTNFIQLQNDVAHLLMSDDWLANVNIVTRDRLVADASTQADQTLAAEVLAYLTERNGRRGCGIIVEKPKLAVTLPNVPGPQGEITLTCLVIEDPMENDAPTTGTNLPADQVGQRILDLGHLWVVEGLGTWRADANALSEADEWRPLRAYNATLRISCNRGQSQRAGRVGIALGGVNIDDMNRELILGCETENAQIYWTRDGSLPGPSNSGAELYNGPVIVPVGLEIRAASFVPDSALITSGISRKTT
jgi:hypothetical protein